MPKMFGSTSPLSHVRPTSRSTTGHFSRAELAFVGADAGLCDGIVISKLVRSEEFVIISIFPLRSPARAEIFEG